MGVGLAKGVSVRWVWPKVNLDKSRVDSAVSHYEVEIHGNSTYTNLITTITTDRPLAAVVHTTDVAVWARVRAIQTDSTPRAWQNLGQFTPDASLPTGQRYVEIRWSLDTVSETKLGYDPSIHHFDVELYADDAYTQFLTRAMVVGEDFTYPTDTPVYARIRRVDTNFNEGAWSNLGIHSPAFVDAGDLAEDSVKTSALVDKAVETPKLGDGAVTRPKFGTNLKPIEKVTSLPGVAALTIADKTPPSIADGTDATLYSVTNWTPVNGKLYLIFVRSEVASGTPNTPTVSHPSLATPVQVGNSSQIGVSRGTLFRTRANAGASGTLTADFGGQTQAGVTISVVEIGGEDTSGTAGSGAIGAKGNNQASPSNGVSVVLDAVPASDSLVIVFESIRSGTAQTWTPATGPPAWTELQDFGATGLAGWTCTHYLNGGAAQTVPAPASSGGSGQVVAVAVEIKKAPASITYEQGDVVVLTTDNKVYRYTGSAWTKEVDETDLKTTSYDTPITTNPKVLPSLGSSPKLPRSDHTHRSPGVVKVSRALIVIQNTTAITDLARFTVPANYDAVGSSWRIRTFGSWSTKADPYGNLTFSVRRSNVGQNGVQIGPYSPVLPANAFGKYEIEITFVCEASTPTWTLIWNIKWDRTVVDDNSPKDFYWNQSLSAGATGSTLTSAQDLLLAAQWSTAHTSNRLDSFGSTIEWLGFE